MLPHLRIKLACGLIYAAEEESVASLAHAQGPFQLVGSHLCHNGAYCIGLNCVTYETQTFDMIREQ